MVRPSEPTALYLKLGMATSWGPTSSSFVCRLSWRRLSLSVTRSTSSIVVFPRMAFSRAARRSVIIPSSIAACLSSSADCPCTIMRFMRSLIGSVSRMANRPA